jgi:2-polyprenyl-3-methyl-5-hydroxy-6-metoxy-1,4-benzoquinol methylase
MIMAIDNHAKRINEYTAGYANSHVDAYTWSTRSGYFYLRRQALVTAELGRLKGGGRLLDIGCGAGEASQLAASSGFEYQGVDVSEDMIRVARTAGKNPDAIYMLGGVQDLMFESGSFDVVLALGVLEYVEADRLEQSMQEIRRVLKPNGVLIASLLNRSSPIWRIQRTREWLHQIASACRGHPPQDRAPEILFTSRQVYDLLASSRLLCQRSTRYSFAILPSRIYEGRPDFWTKFCLALEVLGSTPLGALGMAHLVVATKPTEDR